LSRKLYVHVGPRKTATSAIQRLLIDHDNSVINFPKTGRGGSNNFRGHHDLVLAYFGSQRSGFSKSSASDLFDLLKSEIERDEKNVLISSEILETRDVGAFVDAMVSHLSLPLDVEILFTCREHFSRAASLYNFRLRSKDTLEQRSPDEFLTEHGKRIRYAPLVRKIRNAGLRVTGLNYHPSEDWVKRFLMYVGYAEHEVPEIKNILIAYSPRMLVATLAVRRTVESPDRQFELIKQLSKDIPQSREPSRFIFGREAAMAADQYFSADRKFLKKRFNIDLTPPDLDAKTCEFLISDEELQEIAEAVSKLGSEGKSVVDFARRYVA
jgi:hypothetical protein